LDDNRHDNKGAFLSTSLIPEETMKEVFEEPIASFLATQLLLKNNRAQLIVFDSNQGDSVEWIP